MHDLLSDYHRLENRLLSLMERQLTSTTLSEYNELDKRIARLDSILADLEHTMPVLHEHSVRAF
jgi:hypothetical protein